MSCFLLLTVFSRRSHLCAVFLIVYLSIYVVL